MVSHGAERHASAFKKSTLLVEPVHKMEHQQYSLLKKMRMPVVRGPENRHGFASFEEKNSNSFLKFNPFISPVELNYPLFPHRDDVPLVDPCSGFVSPGADADLQPNVGRAVESLVDYSDWKPHQVPITGKRGQPAHRRQMTLLEETSGCVRRRNSRAVSAASVRGRLRAFSFRLETPVQAASALPDQNHIFVFCMDPNLKESSDPSARWREEKARDYFCNSNTKAYDEVPWDNILPSKIQPPESTVEVLADPVSQCFTKRRYNPEPEISQVVGCFWDIFQTGPFTSPQTPGDFVCVRAVNCEDIDNADVDLIPLNHVQTSKPHYTSTAHTPNIPGYTGKVHWSATHPANSNLPSTTPSIIARMHGYIAKHGSSSQYNHQGPFSQMVTPVSPQNSFNKREQETITV
ncbi:LOW QUALITY PROTEIN: protein SPMIP7 [Ciconia maguari]